MQAWESWKNVSESWKFVLEKGYGFFRKRGLGFYQKPIIESGTQKTILFILEGKMFINKFQFILPVNIP